MIRKLTFIFMFLYLFSLASSADFNNAANTGFGSYNSGAQFSNPSFSSYYSSGDIGTYWPELDSKIQDGQCEAGTDFAVMIPPAGCTPYVVRSDLLEEQNVPVFCKLESLQLNPLIKVSSIKSISFRGKYPETIASVSYHPSRAALRSYNTLLGSPVVNNIGYVVIVLKKQKNESSMPKFVEGNLTATLSFDAKNAFGTGQSEYLLETYNSQNWQDQWNENTFWNGKGVLRVSQIDGNRATIQLMTNKDDVFSSVTLREGETSGKIYFPGFYCKAGVRVKLNSLVADENKALLDIDGNDVWVREGSRILDTCVVRSVQLSAGETGKVSISCTGIKQFDLSLENSYKAKINGETFNVGQNVSAPKENGDRWFLAYAGVLEKSINEQTRREIGHEFIVLIEHNKELPQKTYTDLMLRIGNVFNSNLDGFSTTQDFIKQIEVKGISKDKIKVLFKEDNVPVDFEELIYTLDEQPVSSEENKETLSPEMKTKIKKYFDLAHDAVKQLRENYPHTKEDDSEQTNSFAQDALYQEIQLIKKMEAKGMVMISQKKAAIEKYLELYPDSSEALILAREWEQGNNIDFSNAQKAVYVNNEYHVFSVKKFKAIDEDAKSFELNINGRSVANTLRDNNRKFYEGDEIILDLNNKLIVKDIENRQVKVEYYSNKGTKENQFELQPGPPLVYNPNSVDDQRVNKLPIKDTKEVYNITITDITVSEVASVSLIPEVSTKSEANFTFKIGIEKRAIKLNPEKAAEQADELNKTIKEWEERNAQLGKLVEGWKAACLATGLGLQVKNLLTGFEGKSMARVEVMKSYKQECETNLSLKDLTKDQCYNKLSSQIGKDVDAYGKAIDTVNGQIDDYESFQKWKDANGNENLISIGDKKSVSTSQFTSWEDVRVYLLCQELGCESSTGSKVSEKLRQEILNKRNTQLGRIAEISELDKGVSSLKSQTKGDLKNEVISFEDVTKKENIKYKFKIYNVNDKNLFVGKFNPAPAVDLDLANYLAGFEDKDNVPFIVSPLNAIDPHLILLSSSTGSISSFSVAKVYKLDKATFTDSNKYKILEDVTLIYQDQIDVTGVHRSDSCLNSEKGYLFPKARFYDYGNSKGMPAIVPFNKKEGWYVYVKDSLGGILSDNSKGYLESGAVNNYYICNVGPNGIEELSAGDDNCQSFNGNNPADTDAFGNCGLSEREVRSLASNAQEAIREAARQYKNGVEYITIKNSGFGNIPIEPGLSGGSDLYQCQDFMSPEDCKLMYNVCDPVVCPSSRCDLGGKAPVSNVIQSGIVGSLLLCMPNFVAFGGDVYVPVCLTGVHAGIDGYIQILKAQQSCLAEYSKSGKHVGICDAMTAIYTCDFLWRQTAPLLQGIIPSLFQSLYNGRIGSNSGGGEYASFQASWDNMQKSIDYFKNTYAQTSFRALKFSDVQSFGTEVCNMYVGSSFPTSVEGIDQLLEPESPPQFHATFSEIPFTEATVPPTSQYKVTYMIYAGKQQGVSYTVYMKNPPATSYYQTAQTVRVKVGYIAAGQQVSESKDFTAPSGYKELCVIVGGQEECGFTTVSSSFAVDSLHDLYAKEQGATTDIKTEKECVQGSASTLALVNINAQEGVENAINPNIALQGIVRVCATENPALGTQNQPKWKEVGYCGDENLKCWLDLDSVNKDAMNVLDNVGTIKNAEEAIAKSNDIGVKILSEQQVQDKLIELKTNISKLPINDQTSSDNIDKQLEPLIAVVDEISDFGGYEVLKAKAYSLRYEIYSAVVNMLLNFENPVAPSVLPSVESVEVAETTEAAANGGTNVDKESQTAVNPPTEKVTLFDGNKIRWINSAGQSLDTEYTITNAGNNGWIIKAGNNNVGTINPSGTITITNSLYISQELPKLLVTCKFKDSKFDCP